MILQRGIYTFEDLLDIGLYLAQDIEYPLIFVSKGFTFGGMTQQVNQDLYFDETLACSDLDVWQDNAYKVIQVNVPQDINSNLYDFITNNATRSNIPLTINIYQNTSDNNKLVKTLTLISTLTGSLKEATSLINPIITLELDEALNFNYCYIPLFNRYYFLTNLVNINKKLWELHLHVDVLMSYQDEIRRTNGLIARCEATTYINKEIDDNLVMLENKPIIEYIDNDSTLRDKLLIKSNLALGTFVLQTND